jgi:hypothetical protein
MAKRQGVVELRWSVLQSRKRTLVRRKGKKYAERPRRILNYHLMFLTLLGIN